MKIIQQISTHKAVQEGSEIKIYLKGMDPEALALDGTKLCDDECIEKYPEWFQDELLYSIPSCQKDDVCAIMERYEEDNRCNVAELNGGW